ncbi:MAG: multicopper oxidase domain-containing protein [Flaviflexus sp.]|nr:multicopper oxidase domain-containing protein [Flaviflexus sp.]
MTGAIVIAYLLADGAIILNHRFITEARWLMVHTFTLGAVTNALFIWTEHFTAAILRIRSAGRRDEAILLGILNAGILTTAAGFLSGISPLTLTGVVLLSGAVAGHAWRLWRAMKRALPARFTITVQVYLFSAVLLIPGLMCGFGLASGVDGRWHIALLGAHVSLNVLGWVGLPIVATLLTLWPTILRAQLPPGAERAARRYTPFLCAMPVVAAAGALALPAGEGVMAAGILGFTVFAVLTLYPLTKTTWRMAGGSFPAMSVAAGALWLAASITAFGIMVWVDGPGTLSRLGVLVIPLLGGGIAQVLMGSLGYLLPVMVGGGPKALRVRIARVDTWATFRIVLINLSLALYLLFDASLIMVVTSLAAFIGALLNAVMIIRGIRPVSREAQDNAPPPMITEEGTVRPVRAKAGGFLAAGLVTLLVGGAVLADPQGAGLGGKTTEQVSATGETTAITVTIEGMRFIPDLVEVPVGNQLDITVVNDGDQNHDLVLETGQKLDRLAPGESAVLNAGIIGSDVEGWCSIAGHRQMGMVFHIRALGGPDAASEEDDDGVGEETHDHGTAGPAPDFDLAGQMDPSRLFDPVLEPLPDNGPTTHEVTLKVSEMEVEAAPGLTQRLWMFGDTAPGPVLHGRVGDTFVVTLINDGTMGHSIDFHAGALAPDEPMRTIEPGEELTYTFTAERSGVWMYHCSTAPMSLHIANGMYGAVVIEPENLPEVDRSYILIQGESYYGPDGEIADAQKVAEGRYDSVHFNGYPNQYVHYPLTAKVGERVRFWVIDTGPNVPLSFHIVGGQFDTVFKEGAYQLKPDNELSGGSQALGLLPAEGGFVELTFPEAGHYVAVNHIMSEAERGAKAIIDVSD